jgi:3-hydroxybutyrate dehydrogenase
LGVNIMLNGFGGAADIEKVRSDLATSTGVKVLYSNVDMSKSDEIAAMMRDADAAFGAVDILINNAGIQFVSPLEEFPLQKWDAILAIDLSAAFHTSRCVLQGMKQRGWGRIVNIASAHVLVASPYKSAYVAAKHGIYGLTKTIALEAAEFGITVNAVCPGYVLTPLLQKQIPETAKARGISEDDVVKNVLLAAQPTKKFVTIEEVAATTAFLCSNGAASITGTAIAVDGGWTAH